MRSNTRKAFLAALVCAASINGLPIPQYGPQGMGGYGYPMNGPMMGGGNGPMMGGGNGPMMGGGGQYGMGNQYGPMNMGNNYGDGQYRNGRMRGQRYHAHASPDMWPIPKNPYKAARWNRGNGNMGFYDSGGSNDSDEDLHAPGHNRIPREDDDDDDDSASNGDTKAAGVNRMAGDAGAGASGSGSGSNASLASNENAAMTDSNTSINIAAMSDKILNIGAFDGATIKSTSAAASTSKPAEATQSSSGKVAATAAATGSSRQTVTRSLSKATATQVGRNAKPTPERAHSVVRIPSDKHEGAGESKHASSTAHAHQASHSKAPAATATRREPSMKRIRGL